MLYTCTNVYSHTHQIIEEDHLVIEVRVDVVTQLFGAWEEINAFVTQKVS